MATVLLCMLPILAWLGFRAGYRGHYSFSFWGYSLIGMFYAGLCLYALIGSERLGNILKSEMLQTMGKLSYSLYLVHPVIKGLADRAIPAPIIGAAVGITASLAVSSLLWRFLESPLIRRAHIKYSSSAS